MKRRPANVVEVRRVSETSSPAHLTVETAWRLIWTPAFAGMTTFLRPRTTRRLVARPEAGHVRRATTQQSLHNTRAYVTPANAGVQPDR